MSEKNRLVLGTAQLGLTYGIANSAGKPSRQLSRQIVSTAIDNGVCNFDTAQAYGDSETVLGDAISYAGAVDSVFVTSKISPDINRHDRESIITACNESKSKLNVPMLYGLLLHREEQLDVWHNNLDQLFMDMKELGLIRLAGVSVYSPTAALKAVSMEGIDIIQLPNNFLDRRFENAGIFQRAAENGKTVYIRSAFLQGLTLIDPEKLPSSMQFARSILDRVRDFSRECKLTIKEIALGYLKESFPEALVVFGAETPGQVIENTRIWYQNVPTGLCSIIRSSFPNCDERVLNPNFWPR